MVYILVFFDRLIPVACLSPSPPLFISLVHVRSSSISSTPSLKLIYIYIRACCLAPKLARSKLLNLMHDACFTPPSFVVAVVVSVVIPPLFFLANIMMHKRGSDVAASGYSS
jgi:hypothetical protein